MPLMSLPVETCPRKHSHQKHEHSVWHVCCNVWCWVATILVVTVADLDLDPEVPSAFFAPPSLCRPNLAVLGALSDVTHIPVAIEICFLNNFAAHRCVVLARNEGIGFVVKEIWAALVVEWVALVAFDGFCFIRSTLYCIGCNKQKYLTAYQK
jgi:hypothetical protein